MKEHLLLRSILLIAIALTTCRIGSSAEQNRVHAVVDLGHQFTFYADGRFHRQYLPGQCALSGLHGSHHWAGITSIYGREPV